jgi:membrane-bound ClpP family serine protease
LVLIDTFLIHDVQLVRVEYEGGLVLEKCTAFFAGFDHRLADLFTGHALQRLLLSQGCLSIVHQLFSGLNIAEAIVISLLRLLLIFLTQQSFCLELEVVFFFNFTLVKRSTKAGQFFGVVVFFHLAVIGEQLFERVA